MLKDINDFTIYFPVSVDRMSTLPPEVASEDATKQSFWMVSVCVCVCAQRDGVREMEKEVERGKKQTGKHSST